MTKPVVAYIAGFTRAARQDDGPRGRDHLRLVRHGAGEEGSARGERRPRRHVADRGRAARRRASRAADDAVQVPAGRGVRCSAATSAPVRRSWSSTAGPTSTTPTSCRSSTGSRTRSASSTTTSAVAAGRPRRPRRGRHARVRDRGSRSGAEPLRAGVASPCSGTRGEASLAMEYAVRHPDRVSQLILMGTGSRVGRRLAAAAGVLRRAPPGRGSRGDGGDRRTDAYSTRRPRCRGRVLPDPLQDDAAATGPPRGARGATAVALHRGRRPARARDRASAVRGDVRSPDCDLFPALRRLDVPTLVLHGEHDFVPRRAGRADRRGGSGSASCRCCPGCGHFAYLEAPELVFAEIVRLAAADDRVAGTPHRVSADFGSAASRRLRRSRQRSAMPRTRSTSGRRRGWDAGRSSSASATSSSCPSGASSPAGPRLAFLCGIAGGASRSSRLHTAASAACSPTRRSFRSCSSSPFVLAELLIGHD